MGCAPTKATHQETAAASSAKRSQEGDAETPEKATSVVPVAKTEDDDANHIDTRSENNKQNNYQNSEKERESKSDSEPVKDQTPQNVETASDTKKDDAAAATKDDPPSTSAAPEEKEEQKPATVEARKDDSEKKSAPATAPAPVSPARGNETKDQSPKKEGSTADAAAPATTTTTTSDARRSPSSTMNERRSPQAQQERPSNSTTPTNSHRDDESTTNSIASARPVVPQPMTMKIVKGQVIHGFEVTQVTDSKGYTVLSTISSRTKVDTIARWADRVKRSQDQMHGKLINPQLIARQEKKQSMASLNGSNDRSQSPSIASVVSTSYSQSSNVVTHLNTTSNSLVPGASSMRGGSAVGSSMAPYNESNSLRVVPSTCPSPSTGVLNRTDTSTGLDMSVDAGGGIPTPTTAALPAPAPLPKIPDRQQ